MHFLCATAGALRLLARLLLQQVLICAPRFSKESFERGSSNQHTQVLAESKTCFCSHLAESIEEATKRLAH
jgi:hypothetical protein